jgi:hypothetical protein
MRHNRKDRTVERRAVSMERAHSILEQMVDGSISPYDGYRLLYGLYASSSGLLAELKPLFRLPGIEPDGCLTVDDEFNLAVREAAAQWLLENRG